MHRIGQSRPVHVKYYVVRDTIEERLMQWNTKRMTGMEKKQAAKARALGSAVKSEPGGVKREPGAAAADSESSDDEAALDSSAAARSLRMHSGAQPGNVRDDAVPMRLAELELLFGEKSADDMDV